MNKKIQGTNTVNPQKGSSNIAYFFDRMIDGVFYEILEKLIYFWIWVKADNIG